MDSENKFVEHRRCDRRLVFVRASIVHPLQTEHLSCIVHNISADGALLDIAQAMELPLSFWLRLEGEPVLRLCKVAWRSSFELGVEFSSHILERRRTERLARTHTARAKFGTERRSDIHNLGAPASLR